MNQLLTENRTRRIAVLQSNYIPWKGYFDIIRSVDDFIIYDDMQYTRRDWRNRNRIKTFRGLLWLTIPVRNDRRQQKINETLTCDDRWPKKHWRTLCVNYSKAPCFAGYHELFAELYLGCRSRFLTEINLRFIAAINNLLGITTRIHLSSDYQLTGGPTDRMVSLCKQFRATDYLTGPAAKNYLDESLFEQERITVTWADYGGYPEYRQLYPPFEHRVSVLDLIFNEGQDARRYTRQF